MPDPSFSVPLRHCGAKGLTLVEVLVAMAVLLIGFAGVIALLYGGFVQGQAASDRNAAAILVPEAARAIELEHLITSWTQGLSPLIPTDEVGMFIQTLRNAPQSDDQPGYGDVVANGALLKMIGNLNEWPRRPNAPVNVGGNFYRTRYRLEKHSAWIPHDVDGLEDPENMASEFRGIYLLSLCVYRDSEQDMSKPVQVSEPVVLYLKDRKNR